MHVGAGDEAQRFLPAFCTDGVIPAAGARLSARDIVFILNIDDAHVVNYALKKLQALGLVKTEKRGKEVLYSTNEEGQALCQRYYEIREQVLVSGLTGSGTEGPDLSELARFLRVLSGLYEQAARAATSL